MGTKMTTTINMILSVIGLDDALNAVKLKLGSVLDGNKLGNNPTTPKNVHPMIVSADENQALK